MNSQYTIPSLTEEILRSVSDEAQVEKTAAVSKEFTTKTAQYLQKLAHDLRDQAANGVTISQSDMHNFISRLRGA